MPERVLAGLRRLNRVVAMLVGVGLLACAGFVLLDITLRQVGTSFGGTDEISGYVMAIATSWGMAFTLLELGHVRIDLIRSRLAARGRAVMDLLALSALTLTVTLIAWRCWPVVATSIANDSRANTPLETPLPLVQIPWFAGWAWFALMAWITLLAAAALVLRGQLASSEQAIGVVAEQETSP
jgi:TRAP-type C4-dicarboxylate transport system permease small subunit